VASSAQNNGIRPLKEIRSVQCDKAASERIGSLATRSGAASLLAVFSQVSGLWISGR
jgi:hypothetical protein